MSFEERKKQIGELLQYGNEINKVFGHKDMVRKAVNIMINHLECLSDGGSVAVGDEEKKMIHEITNKAFEYSINRGINDWFRDFANTYSVLLTNWVNNVTQNEELKRKAQAISRLVNANYALKDLLRKVNDLKIDKRNKGATELARHYMRSLENDE